MNKMYKKIEKLNGQIADLQNRIQKLKDSKDFGEAYKALKEEKISLYKRIM